MPRSRPRRRPARSRSAARWRATACWRSRRYSREQELEADRIGLTLLVRAGYRGDAMASLIEKLRRQSQFELQLMGRSPDAVDRRSATLDAPRARSSRRTAARGIAEAAAAGRDGPDRLSRVRSTACRSTMRRGRLRARQQVPASVAASSASRRRATSACSTTRTGAGRRRATARCCSSPAPARLCRAVSPSGCATS